MTKENKEFDKELLVNYWENSSDDDFITMITLFNGKRFSWSLFVGHLLIEKLLKALYAQINNDYPPHIHNLLRLAELCNLQLSEENKLYLATITAFNINTRYDDYKMSFKQKCTNDYTYEWIIKIKETRKWIKSLLKR